MLKVAGCFANEHDLWMVGLAGAICLLGATLTLRFFGRLQEAPASARTLHVALTGVIGGATIWTTHFVGMVAYDPMVDDAYEPVLTVVSLFVAIMGATAGFALAATSVHGPAIELGGAVIGLSVSVMHYLGMSAYQLPGRIVWDPQLVAFSVGLGMLLGALALNRAARAHERHRQWMSVGALTLAICLMHFTGMGAITIELDPSTSVPPKLLSDATLIMTVVAVMSLFLMVGLVAFLIEHELEKQADSQFMRAKLHDALTGLPNRVSVNAELEALSQRHQNGPMPRLAVVTLNLCRFKEINERHGYLAGDAILRTVADRMRAQLKAGEMLARTGGNEFIAIKYNLEHVGQAMRFAERLASQVFTPVEAGDAPLVLGANIGVAASPEHGDDVESLLNNSELAMQRAKEDELETICCFDAQTDEKSRTRIKMTQDLAQAVSLKQLELHFQLQNDVKTRAPVGFEALLRWRHPVHGRVSPAEFIPLAEKTGLIRSIGLWVLHEACKEAVSWDKPLRVAVNVAPQQLVQSGFVEHVMDALMKSGLDARRLELEVTEASIINDQENTLRVMKRLQAMGVRIAMDDFGTGHSSLASLRAFPFDKIKIDGSFVRDAHRNVQSSAIVRSTLLLGGALNIPVLAEGVETEEEFQFLASEGCAEAQGFLFGKPMSVDAARCAASGAPNQTSRADGGFVDPTPQQHSARR